VRPREVENEVSITTSASLMRWFRSLRQLLLHRERVHRRADHREFCGSHRIDLLGVIQMTRFLGPILILASIFCLAGCGGERLVMARGTVMKDGEPLIPDDDQALIVGFIPISEDGKPASNWYAAEVDQQTATFRTAGSLKKGMPPGKYRVAVELVKMPGKKDIFQDKFNGATSPFIREVEDSSVPIILDVEHPEESSN
jgi:hypothetical protein